jgi:hypothetical protein
MTRDPQTRAALPAGAWRVFDDLPLAMESNGPDGYTLTDLRTGARKAYAIARPAPLDLDGLRAAIHAYVIAELPWPFEDVDRDSQEFHEMVTLITDAAVGVLTESFSDARKGFPADEEPAVQP